MGSLNTPLKNIVGNYWLQSTLNSYSLMFFSLDNVFALIILLVTFFSPVVGLCGLLAVLSINLIAWLVGFNRDEIQKGLFGFNALFLGMALGYEYTFNYAFVILFITAVLTLLLVTVWLKGLLASRDLPFLSFPFIISYWIVSLAASHFGNIHINEEHAYSYNEIARLESVPLLRYVHYFDDVTDYPFTWTFFRTLAGTFFQNSVLAGMLICAGLIYFSRIAFSLSVIGFSLVYLFYNVFDADVNDLNYNLLGANFIFLAIGIGCFFLIPNTASYITVIILTPVLILVALSFNKLLAEFQLRAYSLSFSFVCTAFLFTLHQRWFHKYLRIVTVQYFSAEKTIYKYLNSLERFKNEHLYKISLPFAGEWFVSQGYNGKITHLGDWSKALDFVIVDSKSNTYREPSYAGEGFGRENFYCYNKEIYAPFDGYVYDIINTVEENDVGDVNTDKNWGNTVIINHLNGLFSQISHIKKDSFGVFIGQYITKGTYLATCGNSGRSPEPHIHFQFQTTPTVGAPTLAYPVSYFIERKGTKKILHISEVPAEEMFISNVQVNELLVIAFSFLPGQKIIIKDETDQLDLQWDVLTDAYNRTHIFCRKSNSFAYFVNDGTMLYFTDFEGNKNSLLFNFYLAAYRQLLGYYETIEVNDRIPLIHFNRKWVQFFQDFAAPFYLFTKASYNSVFTYADNVYAPQKLIIRSSVEAKAAGIKFREINYELELKELRLHRFSIHQNNKSETYFLTIQS